MLKYFNFTSTGTYTGYYNASTSGTNFSLSGSICQPGNIIKFTDDLTTLTFSNISNLTISNISIGQWTQILKEKWVVDYAKYVGITTLSSGDLNSIIQYADNINLFNELKNPSIAYVTKNLVTNEVSIGCNVYESTFLIDFSYTLADNNPLKNLILLNHIHTQVLISNVCKVNYLGYEEVIWCFEGIQYNYTFNNSDIPSLINGGGNIFGEIKLAGDGVITRYIAKRNIDPDDPTVGICSGDTGPFCMGDEIYLIDTSTWTTNNGSSWSWLSNYTNLNYNWYIADITNPCYDYRNYSVSDMKFPIRVIQFCEMNDFNHTIEYFYYPADILTDIIVRINEHVFWNIGYTLTISDSLDYNGFFADDWIIISKGTDVEATNERNDSNHFRLRKNGFNNTIPFTTSNYKIYLTF